MSIKEEIEQEHIDHSGTVDVHKGMTIARLPFLHNPVLKLCPNKSKALKVLHQQVKKMNQNIKDIESVVQSEGKLQKLGHIEYFKNLPEDVKTRVNGVEIQNYMPWRAVWKDNSISTPCRVVFDASQTIDSGFSLNDLLPKGRNNMNKLVEIFIRWRSHQVGFHTDIQKMYNCVKLDQNYWCFQRYLLKDVLKDNQVEEKIIKTIIYGVKCSGNQAECGLRKTAIASKQEFPDVHRIIMKDLYLDDCISGENSIEEAKQRSDKLEMVLAKRGFSLKRITMSGNRPSKELSIDGTTISIAGLSWQPKDDVVSLDVKQINFAKKCRGRKKDEIHKVPENLTQQHCTSKVAEIFDLTGMLTPIVAAMKLDLHDLVLLKLDWDDKIPDNFRQVWLNHFEMSEINTFKYERAIVPIDAVNMKIGTF